MIDFSLLVRTQHHSFCTTTQSFNYESLPRMYNRTVVHQMISPLKEVAFSIKEHVA